MEKFIARLEEDGFTLEFDFRYRASVYLKRVKNISIWVDIYWRLGIVSVFYLGCGGREQHDYKITDIDKIKIDYDKTF